VPDAVCDEVVLSGKNDMASQQLPHVDWLIKLPAVTVDLDIQRWNLGAGVIRLTALHIKFTLTHLLLITL